MFSFFQRVWFTWGHASSRRWWQALKIGSHRRRLHNGPQPNFCQRGKNFKLGLWCAGVLPLISPFVRISRAVLRPPARYIVGPWACSKTQTGRPTFGPGLGRGTLWGGKGSGGSPAAPGSTERWWVLTGQPLRHRVLKTMFGPLSGLGEAPSSPHPSLRHYQGDLTTGADGRRTQLSTRGQQVMVYLHGGCFGGRIRFVETPVILCTGADKPQSPDCNRSKHSVTQWPRRITDGATCALMRDFKEETTTSSGKSLDCSPLLVGDSSIWLLPLEFSSKLQWPEHRKCAVKQLDCSHPVSYSTF